MVICLNAVTNVVIKELNSSLRHRNNNFAFFPVDISIPLCDDKQRGDSLHDFDFAHLGQSTIHLDDHTFAPTAPGRPGAPSFPAGPWACKYR